MDHSAEAQLFDLAIASDSQRAGGMILHMSIDTARAGAAAWKKATLDKLRHTRTLVREFNGNLDKLCGSVKTLMSGVRRDAQQLSKQYDKNLDEEAENYEEDANTMDALQSLPEPDEQVDDVKIQAGESLEGLLSCLDEFISAVQEVKP